MEEASLLALLEFINVTEEIIRLALSHITINFKIPGFEVELEPVKAGSIVFTEESDRLLEETQPAYDLVTREIESIDLLLLG